MTVLVFTLPSRLSCRNAIQWFEDEKLKYIERRMDLYPLTRNEVLKMLSLADEGYLDLVSLKSLTTKAFQKKHGPIENWSTNLMIDLIIENPKMLKSPIIMNNSALITGFNEVEIRVFIPRKQRRKDMEKILLTLGGF